MATTDELRAAFLAGIAHAEGWLDVPEDEAEKAATEYAERVLAESAVECAEAVDRG
jgi:hypothetical protein